MLIAMIVTRVVSLEISRGKFPEIYSNLSGNFWIFVKEFYFTLYFLIITK